MSEEVYREKPCLLYRFVRSLSRALFCTLFPVKYEGTEHIRNAEAPFILISNHRHALDPLALASRYPRGQVFFMGKKELTKSRLGNWFCRTMGMIGVDRHNSDLAAMRSCLKVLRSGGVLGIFPEGTRHHDKDMDKLESGAFLIALRSKVPLQPVFIAGTLRLFRKTRIIFGERIVPEDIWEEGTSNQQVEKLTDRVREAVLALNKK